MALDKESLKQGLISLQKEMIKEEAPSYEKYAEKLATLIENFVKSGKVVVNKGIEVTTTGTSTAQKGTTTKDGTGRIE
ncbi:hypothetical protein EDM00_12030 [Ornithobacterium rhinotracheale]|uniref:hypothetical protein n=1 Tax=Ornithobacterium rhinotracheale TaxID=28251 RepID=UPI00129CDE29|nr:hypothetical protein [Ornithobacterium rhinotracheale]MRI64708.1 hypothetical protein [Ornithobacterium rhinotracheale]